MLYYLYVLLILRSVWNEVCNMISDQFIYNVDELLEKCKECIERRDLMTVFRLDDDSNKDNEIDVAILQALMKGGYIFTNSLFFLLIFFLDIFL